MNLLVNVQSNLTVHIGNGSLVNSALFTSRMRIFIPIRALSSVTIRAGGAACHEIQPITNEPAIIDVFCRCAPGFRFADPNPPFF
jgi:hypothetical protein